jgi:hypothetical protein
MKKVSTIPKHILIDKIKQAVSLYGNNFDKIKQMIPECRSSVLRKELTAMRPGLKSGKWNALEDLTILKYIRESNGSPDVWKLSEELKRSFSSTFARLYIVLKWVKSEQLKLNEPSTFSSIASLLEKQIHESKLYHIPQNYFKSNDKYLLLLKQGIKKHGLDAVKIRKEFFPNYNLATIIADLSKYTIPNRKIATLETNMKIVEHVHTRGYYNWDEMSKALGLSPASALKRWKKLEQMIDIDPNVLKKELINLQEKVKESQSWTMKQNNLLKLGFELFGNDTNSIQKVLFPTWDKSVIEQKLTSAQLNQTDVDKLIMEYGTDPKRSFRDLEKEYGLNYRRILDRWAKLKQIKDECP